MRILVVGDWHSELHEEAVYDALRQIGHEPLRFSWHQYFGEATPARSIGYVYRRFQYKYMWGPIINRLNADLLALAAQEQPDAIFIYRGTHIKASTLTRLRRAVPRAVLVGYNNDDPFSPLYPSWAWRHFKSGIPLYDLLLAYRHRNLDELASAGAQKVDLLRSWFIPERNHPVVLSAEEQREFAADVVFVGHYEDDGRIRYLEEIVRRGWKLRIFGPPKGWEAPLANSPVLVDQLPVRFVSGRRYNLALTGAKVALCFFSKLNRDTYTRRCFEIPAAGTAMLSSYSEDVASLFSPDREAVYFQTVDEMATKLDKLMGNDHWRADIARAGTARVWRDGHDVCSRMRWLVEQIKRVSAKRGPHLRE